MFIISYSFSLSLFATVGSLFPAQTKLVYIPNINHYDSLQPIPNPPPSITIHLPLNLQGIANILREHGLLLWPFHLSY